MTKTSFADADRQGKSLAAMISETAAAEEVQNSQLPEPEQVDEQVPVESQEVGQAEDRQEGTEPRPVPSLVRRLRESGFDVSDDVDEEDLHGSLLSRLRAQEELRKQIELERQEREKLSKELEEARKQLLSGRQMEPVVQPVPEPAKEDPWGAIEEVDRESLKFIEQDPDTGMYRSRPEYADLGGKEVADKANRYAREMQRRSQALLRDPGGTVWERLSGRVDELVQERAKKIVEEQLKAYDSNAKTGLVSAFEKRQQASEKADRLSALWDTVSAKVLKTDQSGRVMVDLDGNPIVTQVGRQFYEELQYIRDELGVKDEEKAVKTAWRNVIRDTGSEPVAQVEQVAKEEAPVEPGPTREEKKRRFVERRANVDPRVESRSIPAAVAEETPKFTKRISLVDMVKELDG